MRGDLIATFEIINVIVKYDTYLFYNTPEHELYGRDKFLKLNLSTVAFFCL